MFIRICSPHLTFTSSSIEIWSLIREMYFRRKNFYQNSGKNFSFWNTFMIVGWKISFTFRSCIHVLNVKRKLSEEKFNHLGKKNFIVSAFIHFISTENWNEKRKYRPNGMELKYLVFCSSIDLFHVKRNLTDGELIRKCV